MKVIVCPGLWNDSSGGLKAFCDSVVGLWVPDEAPFPEIQSADLIYAHSRGCGKVVDALTKLTAEQGDTLADGTYRVKWVVFLDPVKGSGIAPEGVIDLDAMKCFAFFQSFLRRKLTPLDPPFSTVARGVDYPDDAFNRVLPGCTHAGMPVDARIKAFLTYVVAEIGTALAVADPKHYSKPEQTV